MHCSQVVATRCVSGQALAASCSGHLKTRHSPIGNNRRPDYQKEDARSRHFVRNLLARRRRPITVRRQSVTGGLDIPARGARNSVRWCRPPDRPPRSPFMLEQTEPGSGVRQELHSPIPSLVPSSLDPAAEACARAQRLPTRAAPHWVCSGNDLWIDREPNSTLPEGQRYLIHNTPEGGCKRAVLQPARLPAPTVQASPCTCTDSWSSLRRPKRNFNGRPLPSGKSGRCRLSCSSTLAITRRN